MAKTNDDCSASSSELDLSQDDESSIHSSDYGTSSSVDSASQMNSTSSIGASTMLDFQEDDCDNDGSAMYIQKRWQLKKQEYMKKYQDRKRNQQKKPLPRISDSDSDSSSDEWVDESDSSSDYDEQNQQDYANQSFRLPASSTKRSSRYSGRASSSRSRGGEKGSKRYRSFANIRSGSEPEQRSERGGDKSESSYSCDSVKLDHVDYISKVDVASSCKGLSTIGPIRSEDAKYAFNTKKVPHTIAAEKDHDDISSIGGHSHVHAAIQAYRKKQKQHRHHSSPERLDTESFDNEMESRIQSSSQSRRYRASSYSASKRFRSKHSSRHSSMSNDIHNGFPPSIPESSGHNPETYRMSSAMVPPRLDASRLEALRMQAQHLNAMPDVERGIQERYQRSMQQPNEMMMMVKADDIPLRRTGMELLFVAVITVSLITLVVLLIIMMSHN